MSNQAKFDDLHISHQGDFEERFGIDIGKTIPDDSLVLENDTPKEKDVVWTSSWLERIGFFVPSSKKIRTEIVTRNVAYTTPEGLAYEPTIIIPGVKGLPMTRDYDFYLAWNNFLADHLEAGYELKDPVRVSDRGVTRKLDIAYGTNSRQALGNFFDKMKGTVIKGRVYFDKIGKWKKVRTTPFGDIFTCGDILPNGKVADTNYVFISEFFQIQINEGYLNLVDLDFHKGLKSAMAKSLRSVLDRGWYAAQKTKSEYRKSYSGLCEHFLIPTYQKLSRAKQQIDPGIKELQAKGFVKNWYWEKPQRAGCKDWNIYVEPGARYFEQEAWRAEKRKRWETFSKAKKQTTNNSLSLEQQILLDDIIKVCGGQDSNETIAGYRNRILETPQPMIHEALSVTRTAKVREEIKTTPPQFFFAVINNLKTKNQSNSRQKK